ncbi:hypothetical protein CCACVL1_01668 [Corchorus capsularis]|uniref:Gnk2-homologous domain-containing protein n=1 Tax=Corchorus capsularis TaxID=210143 RepID=A0A1R3KGP6_COCAP|nr:hypothetical protein CCACVL1_01668 [Corchorus capsularis]
MDILSVTVPLEGFDIHAAVNPEFIVFGLGQCYQDIRGTGCKYCLGIGKERLETCLPANSGRIYLDGCFLRYDNYKFYNESIDPKYDVATCGSPSDALSNDTYMVQEFDSKLDQAITNLIDITTERKGNGTVEIKGGLITIHAGAQCWKAISDESCKECLTKAGEKIKKCAPAAEGRAAFTGCALRYSTNRFYPREPHRNDQVLDRRQIIGIVAARYVIAILGAVVVIVATTVAFLSYKIITSISKKKDVTYGTWTRDKVSNMVHEQRPKSMSHVWKHYKDDKITEAIDVSLNGQFNKKEASNALLVGLLCTQASVALRPSMEEVVKMIADANYEIPSPKQPPFLNASVLSPEETVSISLMGSLDLEIGQESSSDKPDNKASPDESSPV